MGDEKDIRAESGEGAWGGASSDSDGTVIVREHTLIVDVPERFADDEVTEPDRVPLDDATTEPGGPPRAAPTRDDDVTEPGPPRSGAARARADTEPGSPPRAGGVIADLFPTGEELLPVVRSLQRFVTGAIGRGRAWSRVGLDWLLRRVWRPARGMALAKIAELTRRPQAHRELDNYSDTFNRKRAKQWRKFEDGKVSSSYLQDD